MILTNAGVPRPWGLERARRGRHYVLFGGSQIGGSNTGQFGALDLVSVGAPNNNIPSGVTVIVDGVTLSAYDAVHGCEPGLVEALRAGDVHANTTVLCRYVNSTSAQDWIDTHFATLAADVATAGITPCAAFYVLASQDALTAGAAASMRPTLRRLQAKIESAWSGCGWAVFGQVTTDAASFPFLTESRTNGQQYMVDVAGVGRRHWLDWSGITLQNDAQHPTSAGEVEMGLRAGRALIQFGVPG